MNELKEQIMFAKKNIKSENSDYLAGYICALSAVEGMIAELEEKVRKHEIVEPESWRYGYNQGYQRARLDYGLEDDDRYGNIDRIIRKLNGRIDEFTKKHPEKKNGVEVESIRELIHTIELEAENER